MVNNLNQFNNSKNYSLKELNQYASFVGIDKQILDLLKKQKQLNKYIPLEIQSLKNHFISFDKNKCQKGKGKNIYSSQNINSYSSRLGIKTYKTKQKKCDEILLKNNIFHFLPQQNNNVSLFDRFINLLVIDGRFEYTYNIFETTINN